MIEMNKNWGNAIKLWRNTYAEFLDPEMSTGSYPLGASLDPDKPGFAKFQGMHYPIHIHDGVPYITGPDYISILVLPPRGEDLGTAFRDFGEACKKMEKAFGGYLRAQDKTEKARPGILRWHRRYFCFRRWLQRYFGIKM